MGYRGGFSRKMKKTRGVGAILSPLSMGTRVKKIHQSQIKITHVKSRCCKILSGKYIIQVSIIYLEIIFTESSRTILINLENNITDLILESPKDIIPKTKLHHQYIQLQIFSKGGSCTPLLFLKGGYYPPLPPPCGAPDNSTEGGTNHTRHRLNIQLEWPLTKLQFSYFH